HDRVPFHYTRYQLAISRPSHIERLAVRLILIEGADILRVTCIPDTNHPIVRVIEIAGRYRRGDARTIRRPCYIGDDSRIFLVVLMLLLMDSVATDHFSITRVPDKDNARISSPGGNMSAIGCPGHTGLPEVKLVGNTIRAHWHLEF